MTRNIKDIAPLLADHFMTYECDATTFDSNKILVNNNAQRLGLYFKYLGLLHDSRFIKTNITSNKFSCLLNDFTTRVFSNVIVDKKNLIINHDKLVFPIQIDFETTNLTFNTVDEDGYIQSIEPTNINEYLYEQIISIDNEIIEIGLIVWKSGNDGERGQHILILMSVKNLTIAELQDNAWAEIFGDAYDNYYKYFKSQLASGRYLSDQSICNELFKEYEEKFIG